jgi:hypothetical protein
MSNEHISFFTTDFCCFRNQLQILGMDPWSFSSDVAEIPGTDPWSFSSDVAKIPVQRLFFACQPALVKRIARSLVNQ